MSLRDEAEAAQAARVRLSQCRVCRFLSSRPQGEREEWWSLFATPKEAISTAVLTGMLKKRDDDISLNSVQRHRTTHRR